MPHPLDRFPLRFSDRVVQNVLRTLSATYQRHADIWAVVEDVGLDGAQIEFDGSARTVWRSIMKEASRTEQLRTMLAAVAKEQPRLAAVLAESMADNPVAPPPDEEAVDGDVQWKGFSGDAGEERQIVEGHDTLLDIVFLELGLDRARSVCRLKVSFGKNRFTGTGFRITDDLILTNHHVLFQTVNGAHLPADSVEAWFGWDLDRAGVPKAPTAIACDVETIKGGADRDWAVVKAVTPIPDAFPHLSLSSAALNLVVDDRVYIIQHPGGRPKMIGMHHNLIRSVDNDTIQYWTDTEGGSSGAPVFDDQWNVVALHHRWVEHDVNGRKEFRNQGQRIDKVIADMAAVGILVGV